MERSVIRERPVRLVMRCSRITRPKTVAPSGLRETGHATPRGPSVNPLPFIDNPGPIAASTRGPEEVTTNSKNRLHQMEGTHGRLHGQWSAQGAGRRSQHAAALGPA